MCYTKGELGTPLDQQVWTCLHRIISRLLELGEEYLSEGSETCCICCVGFSWGLPCPNLIIVALGWAFGVFHSLCTLCTHIVQAMISVILVNSVINWLIFSSVCFSQLWDLCRKDLGLCLCRGYFLFWKVQLCSEIQSTAGSGSCKVGFIFWVTCLFEFSEVVSAAKWSSVHVSLFCTAFVPSSGWRREVLCLVWHSQMNSSQGMKGCIVTLLVSSTRKYSWPFLN